MSETIGDIVAAHRSGAVSPEQTIRRSYARIRAYGDPAVFISLRDEEDVVRIFRTFRDRGVAVTVSTDGPEMMRTRLRDEFAFLCRIGAMDVDEARAANALAHRVSFGAVSEGTRAAGRVRP